VQIVDKEATWATHHALKWKTNNLLNRPFSSYVVSLSKRVFVQNLSYVFDLLENDSVGGTQFHMKGFARRLIFTQRQKATRKRPLDLV